VYTDDLDVQPDSARHAEHRRRLEAWREAHPASAHRYLGLEELEALKAENERLAERDMAERAEVCAAYPTLMTIGNTHKCNLTCNMCFKQLDDVENMSLPDLGLGIFESLGHELFPHLRTVALSVSGEPLISRTIFSELRLLATYGVRASITTNGMVLSRKGLLEELMPALGTLVVSMDGASEPVFDSIRRGASFPRVVANLRRFNEYRDALAPGSFRPRLHFNHILQWKNVAELPLLIELAHELEVEHVAVDYAYIHEGLNDEDSLDRHRGLANRMLEEAARTARGLGVDLRLPEPLELGEGYADDPYELYDDATLLAQGREGLDTVPFDPQLHERLEDDPVYVRLKEIEATGGDNAALVEALLTDKRLNGHLRWGVPQLGPSLIPPDREKVSPCLYPWRECFVEFNGVVTPCCNIAMGAGRILGRYQEGDSFRDIWNGPTYRALRRSLSTGRSYKFCRYCYVVESANEASWGTGETWFKTSARLDGDAPVAALQVPAGRSLAITGIRGARAFEGARLEIAADADILTVIEARPGRDEGGWSLDTELPEASTPLRFSGEQVVNLRCLGCSELSIDLVGYVV